MTPQENGASPMTSHLRIRVGVARFDDGWNVIAEINGRKEVYDPTYATEAEAEAKAADLSRAIRQAGSDW